MKSYRLLFIVVLALLATQASIHAAVAPLVAGPGNADSVWVTVSVNDTLGNAADADTLELVWLYEGTPFDTVTISGTSIPIGQYIHSHVASDNGALGSYQVLVRAVVSGRSPITNYAYVVDAEDPCAGNGPVACTLQVARGSGVDTTAVAHAILRVYNSEETATLAIGETDTNGRLILYLPSDTIHVVGAHPAYTIVPGTVAVDFDGVTDTIWATAFDPGAPASPNLCRVYGWVYGLAGDTIVDADVQARVITAPLKHQNIVVSPYAVSTQTDSAGYWYLDVIPSTQLTPDTTRYEFTIRYPSGAILRRSLAVPDSTEWLLDW